MQFGWDQRAPVMWRVAFILSLLAGAPTPGSAQVPTPAQLEVFRNLPPHQQRAALESMQQGSGSDFADQASQSPDGALLTLQDSQSKEQEISEALATGQALLEQSRSADLSGRLAINSERRALISTAMKTFGCESTTRS